MSMQDAIAAIGQNTNMMPRERGITLPIVARRGGSTVVHRLIYMKRPVPQQGTLITAPQYIATYDLSRGLFLSVEKYEADLADLPPEPWTIHPPAFENPADILPEYERIWSLYDALIPAFERDAPADRRLAETAREYLRYFDRHAEPPLLGLYEKLGGEFLAYVRGLAR